MLLLPWSSRKFADCEELSNFDDYSDDSEGVGLTLIRLALFTNLRRGSPEEPQLHGRKQWWPILILMLSTQIPLH